MNVSICRSSIIYLEECQVKVVCLWYWDVVEVVYVVFKFLKYILHVLYKLWVYVGHKIL